MVFGLWSFTGFRILSCSIFFDFRLVYFFIFRTMMPKYRMDCGHGFYKHTKKKKKRSIGYDMIRYVAYFEVSGYHSFRCFFLVFYQFFWTGILVIIWVFALSSLKEVPFYLIPEDGLGYLIVLTSFSVFDLWYWFLCDFSKVYLLGLIFYVEKMWNFKLKQNGE